MKTINKDLILRDIPLFALLTRREFDYIKGRSNLVDYHKGQIIYREGALPDAFFCIIVGRVVIYAKDYEGNDAILEYLHRGKYFGIISLLTQEPHSVTAKAINDCLLLVIKKDDFDQILKRVPALALDLSRTLSRRLKRKELHNKTIFESTIISVFSSYPQAGKTIYAANLAFGLKKETHKSVVILDISPKGKKHSMPRRLCVDNVPVLNLSGRNMDVKKFGNFVVKDKFGIDLIFCCYNPKDQRYTKQVVGILSMLVNDYHYIIVDLPSYTKKSIFNILNQSDIIHLLTSPLGSDLKKTHRLIEVMKRDFPGGKIKVIVNRNKPAALSSEEQGRLLGHNVLAALPKIQPRESARLFMDKPACEYAKTLRRISRQEGNCLVGLALGIGVAYGFCHIGVLKVIEEEKIPIDVISGSSMGAVIAGLWATGKTAQEILEITRDFKDPKHIWGVLDFAFPLLGFIKGDKLYNFLKRHLGNKTFYDLKIPLKIIASDIKKKEPKLLDQGLVVDAIMASCSMPGVFKPFKFKDQTLFDGGVTHPLPTEPLFEMGVKKIIAVNVTPSRADVLKQYEKIKEIVTSGKGLDKKKWFDLKYYFIDRFKDNILDIIFSSVEVLQSAVAQKEAQIADIVLHPDLTGLHWLEFHKVEEFVKIGEAETRKHLDKILKLVNE